MKASLSTIFFGLIFCNCFSQTSDERRLDSMKKVIQARYDEISVKYNLRNLDTMLSFRSKDFYILGQDGTIQDYPVGVYYANYFLTNNIPPYNIKNTIQRIRVSQNNLVVIADVLQESVRKRELAGKLRDVKVIAEQTETWVNHDGKWLLLSVQNIHGRKRFVDGKRVSDNPDAPYDPNAPEWVDPSEKDQNSSFSNASSNLSAKDAAIAGEIKTQCSKMVDAFLRNDMMAVASFYSDNARIVNGKSEISGRANINKFWNNLKGKGKAWKIVTNSLDIKKEIALQDGISLLTISQDGQEVQSPTRSLLVWEKQKDGDWKISKNYYSAY